MKPYKCWCPECENEGSASEIRAASAQYAAAECAEQVYEAAAGMHCDRIEIHVRDDAGTLTQWEIYPEVEVHFYAEAMAQQAPAEGDK